jgi:hypothetical protein
LDFFGDYSFFFHCESLPFYKSSVFDTNPIISPDLSSWPTSNLWLSVPLASAQISYVVLEVSISKTASPSKTFSPSFFE